MENTPKNSDRFWIISQNRPSGHAWNFFQKSVKNQFWPKLPGLGFSTLIYFAKINQKINHLQDRAKKSVRGLHEQWGKCQKIRTNNQASTRFFLLPPIQTPNCAKASDTIAPSGPQFPGKPLQFRPSGTTRLHTRLQFGPGGTHDCWGFILSLAFKRKVICWHLDHDTGRYQEIAQT